MASFNKRIFLAVIAVGLACAAHLMAQDKVQWEIISKDLYKAVGLGKDPSNILDEIHFVDEKTGFITTTLSGLIRTDDGGSTWRLLYDDGFGHGDYLFLNKDVWFSGYPTFGESQFGRTLDAGKNWQFFKDYFPCFVSSFTFLTPDVGWAVSGGRQICTTKDGGKSWSVVVEYPRGMYEFHSIFMLDSTHGWVGGKGIILATVDGTHWILQLQDPSIWVQGIHFLDKNNGYAEITGRHLDGYAVLYSKDSGQHWDRSSWGGQGVKGEPKATSNFVIQGGRDIWVIAESSSLGTPHPIRMLFHSGNGAQTFESVSTVPDFVPGTRSIVLGTQQGKPVLFVLNSDGVLVRAVLPAN